MSAVLLMIVKLAAFSQISYGPKLGFNFAKIAMSNKNFETSLKPGLYLGGFLNYKVNTNDFTGKPDRKLDFYSLQRKSGVEGNLI